MCLAVPGKILETKDKRAKVDFKGLEREVRIDSLGESVEEGDFILSHAGFAITRISQEEAEETLERIDDILEEGEIG